MGYQRTGFMFELTGSKDIFQQFLGPLEALAEQRPIIMLEVRNLVRFFHEKKASTATMLAFSFPATYLSIEFVTGLASFIVHGKPPTLTTST